MRYPQTHKAETRARILSAAGAAFRARGYEAVGVDEVMAEAGLTAGGFYRHFPSKQALLAASLSQTGSASRAGLLSGLESEAGPALLRAVVGRYLSRTHRDAPALGCPLPSLAAEVARTGEAPRGEVQEYLASLARAVAGRVPPAPGLDPEDRVLATAALLVGGLLLARAVPDPALSDRLLRACRRLAVPELAEEARGAPPKSPRRRSQPKAAPPPALRSPTRRARTPRAAPRRSP
jgi:TetR/AcrR family transcriptional repressor of nem operon